MPAIVDCPEIECWEAFFGDTVSPRARKDYERHLESCAACQARLDRTEETVEPLLKLVRDVGEATDPCPEPCLAEIMQRLHEVKSPIRAVLEEPADLYFLEPCDRPGVLGMLGQYEVSKVIGQGGMGVVLKAFDPALHRTVAIKVLAAAVAGSATARKRFTREAQVAAAVCHDHVVTVHGVHESDGLPYLVMQYVAGESLQDRLDRTGPLPIEEIVRIGQQTAAGLAAAHAQGLIHRDIKPANLLLEGEPDCVSARWAASGGVRVSITDFGLARMVDDVGLTQNGVLAGTPEYMAPEQARGEPLDHRSDLFSLGSVLYALCAGRPPFGGTTTMALLREVSEQQPEPLCSLNPKVSVWLETFIAKLIAKDPAQRFHTAAEVAELLEGYLAHLRQPTTVPAPTLPLPIADRSAKRRFARLPLSTRMLASTALVVVTIGIVLRLAGVTASQSGPSQAAPAPPTADRDEGVWTLAFSSDSKRLITAGGDHYLPGQLQVWDLAAGKPLFTRRGFPGIPTVIFSPDGEILATGHFGGEIKLRDPITGQERTTLVGHEMGVDGLAFSMDGTLLASAGLDRSVKLWDVKVGRPLQEFLGHTGMVFCVAFFRNGKAIVTGGEDRTARIWDLETGKARFVLRGHGQAINAVAVRPNDTLVATGSSDHTIRLWDPANGKPARILRPKGSNVMALVFSPDGTILFSAGWDGKIHFWDVASQKLLKSIRQHGERTRGLAFSPDGKLVASGCEDGTIRVWDIAAGQNMANLSATGALVSPDTPNETAPHIRSRGWLVASLLVVVIVLSAGVGGWMFLRRRATIAACATEDEQDTTISTGPDRISFPCPGCGRKFRAKPELVGKKIKCPQCQAVVLVPGMPAGQASGSS